MKPHQIILDCDPGQDDALAILLALASPEDIDLLAIGAVAGNVPLALTERNARQIVELAGATVPVHAGCARPILLPLETAEYVHGSTGLNGAVLPEPKAPLAPGHAVDMIVETVMTRPAGTVTLCATGPLTNVALAIVKERAIASRLRQIVLMGGAIELGNVTPAAEFNIYVDPEAADIVFRAGVPLVVMPLDVTHKALTSRAWVEGLRALGTQAGRAAASWTDFFERYDTSKYGSAGAPLHDPCVIAYLLDPGLFSGRHIHVAIELEGRHTLGMTVADWWRVTDGTANALFIGEVKRDAFFDLLTERIGRL